MANNSVDELVIDSEADKFLVLFEKIFTEKHIEQENITQVWTQKTVQFRTF